jgi:hypothetical protein
VLSLGVNTSHVPSLALDTATFDDAGTLQQYWHLHLSPRAGRTRVEGELVSDSGKGGNPNVMSDAETSLQPCEAAGTVSLPRVLADGSTIAGWITPTRARLTVRATTTDGKRAVTVTVRAKRKK